MKKIPEITLQENIGVHCEYINTALYNFLKKDVTFKSINQITGYLCAYDAFIYDFKDYLSPTVIRDFAEKFTKVCKKFNIDYELLSGINYIMLFDSRFAEDNM